MVEAPTQKTAIASFDTRYRINKYRRSNCANGRVVESGLITIPGTREAREYVCAKDQVGSTTVKAAWAGQRGGGRSLLTWGNELRNSWSTTWKN